MVTDLVTKRRSGRRSSAHSTTRPDGFRHRALSLHGGFKDRPGINSAGHDAARSLPSAGRSASWLHAPDCAVDTRRSSKSDPRQVISGRVDRNDLLFRQSLSPLVSKGRRSRPGCSRQIAGFLNVRRRASDFSISAMTRPAVRTSWGYNGRSVPKLDPFRSRGVLRSRITLEARTAFFGCRRLELARGVETTSWGPFYSFFSWEPRDSQVLGQIHSEQSRRL